MLLSHGSARKDAHPAIQSVRIDPEHSTNMASRGSNLPIAQDEDG